MPDIIDQIQQRETIGQNQRLEQAVHAADWTSAFSQPQSTESLRAQRNVTDLVAQAMERKAQLAAQTDLNAAKIYETNAKTKEFVEQAPLRDELLRGRIAAQGASTKYKAQQDALTLKDTTDFYNGVNAIKAPIGSREHATAYIENLAAHPMAASTAGVREDIKLHTQVHDTAAALAKAVADYKSVTGFAPESIETTATGGVNLRGKTTGGNAPVGVADRYAVLQGQIAGHEAASNIEADSNAKAKLENKPYSKSGSWAAAEREARALEARYPDLITQESASAAPAAPRKALDEIFK